MVLGRPVVLDWAQSDQPSEDTIDPATVCGEVSVEQGLPGRTAATMPAAIALPSGTRFDLVILYVVASGMLAHRHTLLGADAPVEPRCEAIPTRAT